jgi:hypothetical protein
VSNKPLDEIFRLPTESKIDPNAAVFDSGSISRSHVAEHEAGMGLTGMAPKPRDPAVANLIQAFLAPHSTSRSGVGWHVRLKHALVSTPSIPIQCDRPYTPQKEGQKSKRPLARPGLTRCPQARTQPVNPHPDQWNVAWMLLAACSPDPVSPDIDFEIWSRAPKRELWNGVNSAKGRRYVREMADYAKARYKPVPGENAHRDQKRKLARLGIDASASLSFQGGWMSLAEAKHSRLAWDPVEKVYRQAIPKDQKLPKEGKLPERSCANPECMLEIEGHHNTKYCPDDPSKRPGEQCRERAKELRRLDRKSQAGRPILYRNESDISADLTNDNSQLETGVISPHISRGIVSKDCPAEVAAYQ